MTKEDQQTIVFWLIVSLFLIVSILLIGSIFFNFGKLPDKWKDLLVPVFIVELGAAVYAILKQKSSGTDKAESKKDKEKYDKIYDVKDAAEFYNKIAKEYDERNTEFLLETHKYIIKNIDNYIKGNEQYKILDLGGGTGRLIAMHFINRSNLEWVNLDNSSAMVEQFRKNLGKSDLKTNVILSDLFDLPEQVKNARFNIIILSIVLTSLPKYPDFKAIKSLLDNQGILIVADIDPVYASLHPHYDVDTKGDGKYALKTNQVHPLDVIEVLSNHGFKTVSAKSIKMNNKTGYSYVLVFRTIIA